MQLISRKYRFLPLCVCVCYSRRSLSFIVFLFALYFRFVCGAKKTKLLCALWCQNPESNTTDLHIIAINVGPLFIYRRIVTATHTSVKRVIEAVCWLQIYACLASYAIPFCCRFISFPLVPIETRGLAFGAEIIALILISPLSVFKKH